MALVGPSGSGKSTLLDVVLGFTAPEPGGTVRVGGETSRNSTRRRGGRGSPGCRSARTSSRGRSPRTYGSPARTPPTRRYGRALQDAGADGFVAELPAGLDTPLGEDGAGLSAGQRQRLALARAFLADRPLLLLDEPTAALDGETEAGVVDAVRRLAAGRTVLLVVHRPALLAVADRVVGLGTHPGTPVATPSAGGAATAGAPGTAEAVVWSGTAVTGGVIETAGTVAAAGGSAPDATAPHGLRRVRGMAGELKGRMVLALLLGSLALGSAVGLMAVSGWLISRASEQPPSSI